ASATVPRGVGTVNVSGNFTLAVTSTTAFDADQIRSAVADGAGGFWASGNNRGVRYFGPFGSNVQVDSAVSNTRVLQIINGDLYWSAASVQYGLHKQSGLPTTLSADTFVIDTQTSKSFPSDFALNPS